MIKRIIQIFNNNKKVIENFSFLSLFQVFTLLSPLITYPYIIKVVGLEAYGLVIFAQTIVSYFSLFINFGFGTSGPRDVALTKNNPLKLSELVSSIFLLKLFILIISFIIYLIIISLFKPFSDYFLLFLFSFFMTIGDLLFPSWFFQGIEKMKYITYINIFVRSIFIFFVFIFINDSSDFIYIPLLNSFSGLLSGIISIFILVKFENISFVLVPKKMLVEQMKSSFILFVSTFFINIYMKLNKIIIGSFLGMSEVALYDLGEKIINILKIPIFKISEAVFPKISINKSISFINKTMCITILSVTIMYVCLFFSSDWIVYYFLGYEDDVASNIVKILGGSLLFLSFNMFFGGLRLIPFGYDKDYSFVMVTNGIIYLILMLMLWGFNYLNIYSVSFVYVIVEIICSILLFNKSKKLKLIFD